MKLHESNLAVRQLLAKYSHTKSDDWFLTFKARQGMAVVFQAIHDIEGSGEVITQPYTCITAVNPIIAGQLKPVYCDTDSQSLSLKDPAPLLSERSRAIVLQHTYGITNPHSTAIARFAHKHHLLLIEDSAHCLTRMTQDDTHKILADISVHSFGVEKVLQSTKFGGAIYVNPDLKSKNPDLYQEITSRLTQLASPSVGLKLRTRTYRAQNAFLHLFSDATYHKLRVAACRAHIFELAVTPDEQQAKQPKPLATSKYVNETILKYLPTLPANYNRRRKNTARFFEELNKSPLYHPVATTVEPLLAFPLLFKDASVAARATEVLTRAGFYARHYSPLFHPGYTDRHNYSYDPKMAPNAESLHTRVICLQTDLSPEKTTKIIEIINSL